MTTVTDLVDLFESEAARDLPSEETPDIGIIMGSDSDLDVMMGTADDPGAYHALTDLGFAEITDYGDADLPGDDTSGNDVPGNDAPGDDASGNDAPGDYSFEAWVVSAHRTPDFMYAYAETAADRGLDVIIAGAGGKSADLPNMTASLAYPIPVVGVPVQEKSVDSVIGMPTGAPITAVDAGKSYNAALSAAQMLATDDPELRERLRALHEQRRDGVADVSRSLHEQGTERFQADRE